MNKQAQYQVRVNGVVMPYIRVQNAMVDGEPIGELELAVEDDTLGWFVVNDEQSWGDSALPQFMVEIRDTNVPPIERRRLPNKGWERVTVREYLSRLSTLGVIQ